MKAKKFAFEGVYPFDGRKPYIQAWREGRGRNAEIVVQVWNSGVPVGMSDDEWGMPGCLSIAAAIEQSILQTKVRPK